MNFLSYWHFSRLEQKILYLTNILLLLLFLELGSNPFSVFTSHPTSLLPATVVSLLCGFMLDGCTISVLFSFIAILSDIILKSWHTSFSYQEVDNQWYFLKIASCIFCSSSTTIIQILKIYFINPYMVWSSDLMIWVCSLGKNKYYNITNTQNMCKKISIYFI